MKRIALLCCALLLCAESASAAGLFISLGVRETNVNGAIGADGGSSGGIEWVNKDVPFVAAGSGWQELKFDLQNDPIAAFAGGSADGILGTDYGTIEHLRLLNDGGATQYKIYIDDVIESNSGSGVGVISDFESFSVGDEVVFQEPTFSGSTSGNLVAGGGSGVTDTMAHTGNQSYLSEFEFIDNDPTRWVRLTTFNAANVPNPIIETQIGSNVVSLWVKVEAIPEPSTLLLGGVFSVGLLAIRLRNG